jgi:hypothetical protein
MRGRQYAENVFLELREIFSESYPEADLEIMRLNKHLGSECILRFKHVKIIRRKIIWQNQKARKSRKRQTSKHSLSESVKEEESACTI